MQLLLLPNVRAKQTRLNGREAQITMRRFEDSTYLVLPPR